MVTEGMATAIFEPDANANRYRVGMWVAPRLDFDVVYCTQQRLHRSSRLVQRLGLHFYAPGVVAEYCADFDQ